MDNTFNFNSSLHYNIKKIYSNVFYAGFEDSNGVSGVAHTGSHSHVGSFTLLLPKKLGNYVLSYWTNAGSAGWEYHTDEVVVTSTDSQSLTIGDGGVLLDDIRLYPKEASMTTYTHDPLVGITSISDVNCITTYYDYDEFGRLEYTKDNGENVTQGYDYHYRGQ